MVKGLRGQALRKGRVSIDSQIYLVTTVTNKRIRLFSDLFLGRMVVHELMQNEQLGSAETLAFVIMPDHIHWLFALGPGYSLSNVINGIKSYSARSINNKLSRPGIPVWQRGFHDHALRREEDFKHIVRYVVANPLRAGLVRRIGDYPLWDAVWL